MPQQSAWWFADWHRIVDYRKRWQTACVVNGLGAFYCRDCRDAEGKYIGKLDATRHCERCGKKWAKDAAKYVGKICHDFRRLGLLRDAQGGQFTGRLRQSLRA